MKKSDLEKILTEHTLWLHHEGGKRADLSRADLSRADLSGADLRWADLSGANLRWADLSGANLRWADLSRANLSRANLSGADLSRAALSRANLSGADLSRANLSRANLSGADLSGANLSEANLDFSVLPLWCGSLGAKADERIIRQLIYHTLRLAQNSGMNCNLKAALFTKEIIEQANLFHRVESGEVERIEDETLADSICAPGKTVETLEGKD
jgi:uncharacterized protein YjbI with pentapeptide repeats